MVGLHNRMESNKMRATSGGGAGMAGSSPVSIHPIESGNRRRLKTMRGPLSFSVNDEAGLLIDAFDEPPLIRMTYNPPYYVGLIEGYGFQKIQDLYAYAMFESEEFPKRMRDISDFSL